MTKKSAKSKKSSKGKQARAEVSAEKLDQVSGGLLNVSPGVVPISTASSLL